jgi:uncharacterized protein
MKLVSMSVVCTGFAWAALLGAADDQAGTITVTGTTLLRVAPDSIVWSIHMTTTDKALLKAKRENDERVKSVIALREELGVAKEDLTTGQLSVYREYERDSRTFKHFVVRRDITIRERDLAKFDLFLEKLASRAEFEGSFAFESSRLPEAKGKARLQALKAAEEKAQALARQAGAQTVAFVSIEENPVAGRGYSFGGNITSNVAYSEESTAHAADVEDSTMIPEAIEVSVSVKAVFRMR